MSTMLGPLEAFALTNRVVTFAAGTRTLAPGQLDQPAVIKPCSGAFVHHRGSLMDSRGPVVHVFEPKHNTTLTPPALNTP